MEFLVPDMTCGHCASVITKTLTQQDTAAAVDINLETKIVSVKTTASPQAVTRALTEAGYSPQLQQA